MGEGAWRLTVPHTSNEEGEGWNVNTDTSWDILMIIVIEGWVERDSAAVQREASRERKMDKSSFFF